MVLGLLRFEPLNNFDFLYKYKFFTKFHLIHKIKEFCLIELKLCSNTRSDTFVYSQRNAKENEHYYE